MIIATKSTKTHKKLFSLYYDLVGFVTDHTSYENTPKWHGFLLIRLAASNA